MRSLDHGDSTLRMTHEWAQHETDPYQDHVIAHVIGTTVLGMWQMEGAVHLLLDIGFIWTIYADADMALVLERVAIKEFAVAASVKETLQAEVDALHEQGGSAEGLNLLRPVPPGCLVTEVKVYARGERRRVLIEGSDTVLVIEGEPGKDEITATAERSL